MILRPLKFLLIISLFAPMWSMAQTTQTQSFTHVATKQEYRPSRADETEEQSFLMVASQKDLALQPQKPVFVPPTSIPAKEFNVLDYGAKADGTTLNSRPIQAAIDAAAAAGGGHVIIPSGQFLCGPILLKNNIDLHLNKEAVLQMSRNFDDFPVRGNDHQAFILAAQAHDVEISGEGLIDGQGEHWWKAFRKVKGAASTGPRRPPMILFTDCQRVKLEGFSTRNPPGVHCAMRDCSEVIIQGLTMTAPEDSPNTDALNLRVKRAVIRKCRIATGDDNIVLCSGAKPQNGNPLIEDVTISDCKLGVGHGLSIGSYTTGGVRNVRCENIEFEGTTSGIRLKAARDRGGLVEQLVYRNLTMKNVRYPILITSYYPKMPKQPWDDAEQPAGATTPFWRNVTIENLTATGAQTAMIFWGVPERPVSDISLKNVNVSAEKGGNCCFASNIRCSEVQISAASGPCMLTYQGGITGVEATPMEAPTTEPATETAHSFTPGRIHIVLVGDSTVTDNAGWGKGFARAMRDDVEVINLARGGRSSKSAIAEGMLQQAVALKPDYLLIQFGHNDQPGHGDRETDPQTSYKQAMTQYVDEARAAGIKPVLVTSLSRRQWKHGGRKINSLLQPWADAVKEIAAAKKVPLVDLHARSVVEYEILGMERTKAISPSKNADPAHPNADTTGLKWDGTHLNAKGRRLFGMIVAEELGKAVPELASHLSGDPMTAAGKRITVSADGKGDFKTVQDAIAAVPDNGKERTVIHIEAGNYAEPIVVPKAKTNLTLEGATTEKTILDWNRSVYDPIPEGHDKCNPGLHVRAPDFRAENLTIQNSAGDRGQALAVRVDSDRVVFKNCHILGWQDTLRLNNGRSCFKECRIEGRVDFIYGNGTAVFDRCEIKSKNGGNVTAASTPADHPYGFVFLDCKLTGDPAPWIDPRTSQPPRPSMGKPMADLGRPWGPHASVTYLNCEMGDHIMLAGWNNWGKAENEKTARYAEYNSTGLGAKPKARVPWAKQLTKEEAAKITIESVIGGGDDWRPQ